MTLSAAPKEAYDHAVFERAAAWVHERGGFTADMLEEQPARAVIAETFRVLDTAISSGISVEMPDELVGLLQNNAFIFSGLKTYHSLNELGLSLVDKRGGIKPFEEFHKDVVKIDEKYNLNYLYAEYNHAVSSSQMASKWHEFEQDGDRYDLQYRTADDDKVREEHALLQNITLPFNDPFWKEYLPPNGWNCRCTAVQVRKGKYPTSDSARSVAIGNQITEEKKARMFRFNPGIELKIFPDKHPYNKAPREAKAVVTKLAKETFFAKTIDDATKQFQQHLGVNCDLSGFKKKDISQIKEIFDCVDRHFREFPELKEKVKFVGSMNGRVKMLADAKFEELKKESPQYPPSILAKYATSWARKRAYLKDCYAYSSEGESKYELNGLAFNTAMAGDKIISLLKSDLSAKFHPEKCDTVKSVFDHELGHKLDALLNLSHNAAFLKIYNDVISRGEQYVKDNLSGYAYNMDSMKKQNYTSQKEFIAEAWSEYLNNPTPRPIASSIGKLIEAEYKAQKSNH